MRVHKLYCEDLLDVRMRDCLPSACAVAIKLHVSSQRPRSLHMLCRLRMPHNALPSNSLVSSARQRQGRSYSNGVSEKQRMPTDSGSPMVAACAEP